MTPSNATNATALAGNARKKHGTKPLQYPFHPLSRYTAFAASDHFLYFLSGSFPSPSVIIFCLTTSEGYENIQNICALKPPAQKLTAGSESLVCVRRASLYNSYVDHQQKKKVRNRSVAKRPWYSPLMPCWLSCVTLECCSKMRQTYNFATAVYRPRVQSFGLVRRILNL
jgi:hypothetical protein